MATKIELLASLLLQVFSRGVQTTTDTGFDGGQRMKEGNRIIYIIIGSVLGAVMLVLVAAIGFVLVMVGVHKCRRNKALKKHLGENQNCHGFHTVPFTFFSIQKADLSMTLMWTLWCQSRPQMTPLVTRGALFLNQHTPHSVVQTVEYQHRYDSVAIAARAGTWCV